MAVEAPVNGVGSTLSAACLSSDTTIALTSATGFTNSQYHILITDGTNYEISLATALSGTTLTVSRAVEAYSGTTSAYGFAAGSTVTVIPSVASVSNIIKQAGDTSSMTFTRATGFPVSAGGTGTTTSAITTANVGDLIVLCLHTTDGSAGTGTGAVTAIYGQFPNTISDTNARITWDSAPICPGFFSSGDGSSVIIWKGVVTSTGTTTVTVTYSSSVAAVATRIFCDEFTPSSGTVFSLGVTNLLPCTNTLDYSTTAAHTSVAFPPLTAPARGGLYWSYDFISGTGSAGSTTGYTYTVGVGGNLVAVNGSITPGTLCNPTATQTSGNEGGLAVIIVAH